MTIAPVTRADAALLPELTALCLRSKAHWGYDATFMDACRAELTLTHADLEVTQIAVIRDAGKIAALAQVSLEGRTGELDKLFVDPPSMGNGHGRRLCLWALDTLRARDADCMMIASDPGAAAFYRRMGARPAGTVRSGSIPGRHLPLLRHDLSG